MGLTIEIFNFLEVHYRFAIPITGTILKYSINIDTYLIYMYAYVCVCARFLDEYRKHGLKFWALTTGNEPLNGIVPIKQFNSMGWTPQSHREWIGQHMGPRLKNSEHNSTLLFAIDDQRIVLPWWMKIVRWKYSLLIWIKLLMITKIQTKIARFYENITYSSIIKLYRI